MEGAGIATLFRDGGELTDQAIDSAYRNVKDCIFCGKRSEVMSLGMAAIEPDMSFALGGPYVRHARALLYGVCKTHKRLAENNPEYWGSRLDDLLHSGLRDRLRNAARRN
jgi:hypothetical protein